MTDLRDVSRCGPPLKVWWWQPSSQATCEVLANSFAEAKIVLGVATAFLLCIDLGVLIKGDEDCYGDWRSDTGKTLQQLSLAECRDLDWAWAQRVARGAGERRACGGGRGMTEQAQAAEDWRPVPGFEYYSVNSLGNVRGASGKLLTPNVGSRGYLIVQLWHNGKNCGYAVHTLVARAFIGIKPPLHEVNHKDGNKTNPTAENLEYVTRSQNMAHAYRLGLRVSGGNHHWAKLTDAQVASIRAGYVKRVRGHRQLANEFGVGPATIKAILANRIHRRTI